MSFEPFEEVTSGLWVICPSLASAATPELSASVGPLLGHLPLERLLLMPGTQGGLGQAPEQRSPGSLGLWSAYLYRAHNVIASLLLNAILQF